MGVMNGRLCSLFPTVYIKRDATPNRHDSKNHWGATTFRIVYIKRGGIHSFG